MNSDTAEIALETPAQTAAAVPSVAADTLVSGFSSWRGVGARSQALRDSLEALLISRLLVLAGGVVTVLVFGYGPVRKVLNPPGVTSGFGRLGDLLAAPVARWDSVWYLVIAHYGYKPGLGTLTSSRAAFFPLYPLTLKAISSVGVPPVLAGVLVSLIALTSALYGIHRLCELEFGPLVGGKVGRMAVLALAFAPMAFYLSAVYSEALYLALSIGVFLCARRGRFAVAVLLASLAGATRSTGLVLVLALLIIYFYGPREDREPDRQKAEWWRARYRPRKDLLWFFALPVGVLAYMGYLALSGGNALEPFHAQEVWSRHFVGPYLGIWDGAKAAFDGGRQLLSFQSHHIYFAAGTGSPSVAAGHNLMLFGFLALAAVMTVGVMRRLPFAYGSYVLAALALPLSYPVSSQPLMSLPRFLLVLFPLSMWSAAWLVEHPRAQRPLLGLSAALMVFFLGQFATWHWVA